MSLRSRFLPVISFPWLCSVRSHVALPYRRERADCLESGQLAWVDLQVISANRAPVRLYQRAGFIEAGEIADMFRIDGRSFDYATMSKRLGAG
jgi:hypothetical protein